MLGAETASQVQQSVHKWKPGQRIEVTLTTGDKLVGRLGAVQSDGFALEPDRGKGANRELRFDTVRSIHTKMTRGKKWAIAGGVYAGLVVMGLIVGK